MQDSNASSRRGRKHKNVQENVNQEVQKRVYGKGTLLDHDLFKLKGAYFKKNLSWNEVPRWDDVIHQHYYHTMDSSGRRLYRSSTIGGHFHEIEIEINDGVPKIISVSGPKKEIKKKINGKWKKVTVDFLPGVDNHTHDAEYLRSEKISLRQANVEAQKVIAHDQKKASAPAGIIG